MGHHVCRYEHECLNCLKYLCLHFLGQGWGIWDVTGVARLGLLLFLTISMLSGPDGRWESNNSRSSAIGYAFWHFYITSNVAPGGGEGRRGQPDRSRPSVFYTCLSHTFPPSHRADFHTCACVFAAIILTKGRIAKAHWSMQ